MPNNSEKNSTTLQTGVEPKTFWMKRINQLYPSKICFTINSYIILNEKKERTKESAPKCSFFVFSNI